MPWPRLIQVPRQALDLVQPLADLRIDYLPRTGFALLRLLLALKVLRRTSLIGDLVLGAPTRTAEANGALEALAEQVRADPRLADAVDPRPRTAQAVPRVPCRLRSFPRRVRSPGDGQPDPGHPTNVGRKPADGARAHQGTRRRTTLTARPPTPRWPDC
jgi:hypothetical protein